ncbi:MAG: DUF4270 domain-containing protein [Bacteroidetes bacterium]|nr:DUF4270 domain-containing protein [Bacteroidota bacterium]MBS1930103.1 DUF4270 domain-containing protein [Bacteroidota bacterium]
MFSRTTLTSCTVFVLAIALWATGCQKINDATTLGGDLIPAVDNVSTFDTTISVNTYNGLFTNLEDSTVIGSGAEHFAGSINNDPLFGKTSATMYLQLKPSFPYTFDFKKIDSLISLDSVVLVLDYTRTYGDSLSPMNLSVKELDHANIFRYDSNYLIRNTNFILGATIGSVHGIIPANLDDSVKVFRDTTKNQLRIPLNNSFGMQLLSYDSTDYSSDSAFQSKFKGFAVIPDASSGNALLGFDLLGKNTKLAFYYHYKSGAVTDTATVTYFSFGVTCAHADVIERDYTGSQLALYQGGITPDDLVFIQNTPGSFATIKIPDLKLFPNRVIHRAELIAEQVYDPSPSSDNTFAIPKLLFLDAYDSAKQKYRTVPYDFIVDPSAGPNYTQFGMIGKSTLDGNGKPISVWKFNVTRYVQNYLTRKEPLYDLRLSAPFTTIDLYRSDGVNDVNQLITVNSLIAAGRVRLGGGNNTTQRMRLHIIYSKL